MSVLKSLDVWYPAEAVSVWVNDLKERCSICLGESGRRWSETLGSFPVLQCTRAWEKGTETVRERQSSGDSKDSQARLDLQNE